MLFPAIFWRGPHIVNDHDQRANIAVLASFARSRIDSTCVGVKEAVIYHFVDFVCDTQF